MEKHPLHIKTPELQTSPEVSRAVEREERKTEERVPNDPSERIDVYMERLEGIFLNPDEKKRERNLDMLRDKIYDALIIKKENFPNSFFELQQRIARERGQAVEQIPNEVREQMMNVVIEDQKHSLDVWIDYLSSEDAVYPAWFKYYVWTQVTKLSQFDKERGEFKKRTNTTVAPYPDIYNEPLAQIADTYLKVKEDNKHLKDPEIQDLFSKKFPTLYAELISKSLESSMENREQIRGEWVKYLQGDDGAAEKLFQSLEGKGTGWCTAGKSTAETQIKSGDFYVYYTYDSNGEPTQPRLAIRMNGNNNIGEVRGILPHQSVEPLMQEVLDEKLSEFGNEADTYRKKSENMKTLTSLEQKQEKGEDFTETEVEFLYEINSKIEGFGYQKDPRIEEVRKTRNFMGDMKFITGIQEPREIPSTLIKQNKGKFVAENIRSFEGVDENLLKEIITQGYGHFVAENLLTFYHRTPSLTTSEIGIDLIKHGYGSQVINNIYMFKGFSDSEEIAILLIKKGNGAQVSKVLSNNKFKSANKEKLALFMIQEGQGNAVVSNLKDFKGIDQNYIVKLLFQTEQGRSIIEHINKFQEVDHQNLMEKLIDDGFADEAIKKAVSYNSGFKMDGEKTIRYLLEKGMVDVVKMALKEDDEKRNQKFVKLPEDIAILLISEDFDFACQKLKHFSDLSIDVARLILSKIGDGDVEKIFKGSFGRRMISLDSFTPDARLEIARYFTKHMEASDLIGILDNFKLENADEITALLNLQDKDAEFLDKVGEKDELLEQKNHEELAQSIIKSGKQKILLNNLKKLRGLSKETAAALVASEGDKIIKDIILYRMDSFDSLPADFAFKTLTKEEWGEAKEVKEFREIILKNLKKFSIEDDPDGFFLKLVNLTGNAYYAARYLNQFPILSRETAMTMIDKGAAGEVVDRLDRFQGVDSDEMFEYIMNNPQKGSGKYTLSDNITKFKNINLVKAAEMLIEEKQGGKVAKNLSHFRGLNHIETAKTLIESGNGSDVAGHLNNFEGIDHVETARKLIDVGQGDAVAQYLNKFEGVNYTEIAEKLVDSGSGSAVAKYLNNFKDINQSEIARKLIISGNGSEVEQHISNFQGVDSNVLADLLMQDKKITAIAENLYYFRNLKNQIAVNLIHEGYVDKVAANLSSFEGLSGEIATELTQAGKGFIVIRNLNKFSGINYLLLATTLINMREAETVACHIEKFIGVDKSVIIQLIKATGQEKILMYTKNEFDPVPIEVSYTKDKVSNKTQNNDFLDLSQAFNREAER